MKANRLNIIVCLFCAVGFLSLASAQIHPRELPEPKEISFKPPKPVEFTLSNGIHIYYFEDKELPLISLNAMLKGGSLFEPPEKAGLANLTGTVQRTGGTKTLTGDKIDEELEFLAASVESFAGQENMSVSANCLKKDFKRVLEIFADVVRNPEFRQEKIDLAKNQMKESIRRRWDMPASVASTLFIDQVYGGTPYGIRTSNKTLNAIAREDLIAFHKQYFAPNNMYLAIVGDISQSDAKSMLEGAFKGWEKKDVKFAKIPSLVERANGTVYYAARETPQANVVMGHLGIKRNDPDETKLEVMNDIFGGGSFTARLMKEIRSNRGLTYGIYGGVFTGRDKGLFRISSQLKAEKSVEALALVKDMIKDIQNTPVLDEEMQVSQKSLVNSFVFQFESKDRLASQYMSLKLDGYPDNYFDTYIENIKKITKKDIQDVAKKYMDPNKMIILVVGDEKKFDKPLSTLGKVEELDYKKLAEADKSEK
jgi:predicted Zn-dependent peptidase